MNKQLGFISLLLSAILFSFFGVFVRQLDTSFGKFTQVAVRCIVATFIMGIIVCHGKQSLELPKISRLKLSLFLIGYPLSLIFYTFSAITIKATNAIFYLYVASFVTSFFIGRFFFREKITVKKVISLFLAVFGLFLFAQPLQLSLTSIGVFFGIASGVFDSSTNSLRRILGPFNRQLLLLLLFLSASSLSLLLATITGEQMVTSLSFPSLVTVFLHGACLVIIGMLTFYGFNNFDLNLGTIVISSELFFAMIVNALVLFEYPTATEVLGGTLIFLSLVTVNTFLPVFNKSRYEK